VVDAGRKIELGRQHHWQKQVRDVLSGLRAEWRSGQFEQVDGAFLPATPYFEFMIS